MERQFHLASDLGASIEVKPELLRRESALLLRADLRLAAPNAGAVSLQPPPGAGPASRSDLPVLLRVTARVVAPPEQEFPIRPAQANAIA